MSGSFPPLVFPLLELASKTHCSPQLLSESHAPAPPPFFSPVKSERIFPLGKPDIDHNEPPRVDPRQEVGQPREIFCQILLLDSHMMDF